MEKVRPPKWLLLVISPYIALGLSLGFSIILALIYLGVFEFYTFPIWLGAVGFFVLSKFERHVLYKIKKEPIEHESPVQASWAMEFGATEDPDGR